MSFRSLHQKGFTLVELLVTISIFVFMTGLILARYNNFNTGTLLTNMAYDVAITIRQAQTYGISVKSTDIAASNFNAAYGVMFDSSTSGKTKFYLFSDGNSGVTPNGIYTGSGIVNDIDLTSGDSIISQFNLKKGAIIESLCAGQNQCPPGIPNNIDKLFISFKRPDPSAKICSVSGGSSDCNRGYAEIHIKSSDGKRIVSVSRTGQISVK